MMRTERRDHLFHRRRSKRRELAFIYRGERNPPEAPERRPIARGFLGKEPDSAKILMNDGTGEFLARRSSARSISTTSREQSDIMRKADAELSDRLGREIHSRRMKNATRLTRLLLLLPLPRNVTSKREGLFEGDVLNC